MGSPASLSHGDKQALKALQKQFQANNVDVAVLDVAGALNLWLAAQRNSGASQEAAVAKLKAKLQGTTLDSIWDKIESTLNFGKSWTATAQDVKLLTELGSDMKKGGSLLSRYVVKDYNGKKYIILKGYSGLRKILTGTRYLAANTKVASMGLGTVGAAKSIKGGMVLTLILSVGFRAMEQLMKEEATWHDFVGGLAGDVVKIGVAGGASMIAASLAGAGAATVGAIAVGPLFAAIVVGVAVGVALDYLDDKYGFTQALINGLKEAESNLTASYQEAKRQYNWYTRNPVAEYNFWMRVFGAQY